MLSSGGGGSSKHPFLLLGKITQLTKLGLQHWTYTIADLPYIKHLAGLTNLEVYLLPLTVFQWGGPQ